MHWAFEYYSWKPPFFAPRKCFEKDSEKCHVDSLSNIVASCSWDKHVTIGTGSRLDDSLGTQKRLGLLKMMELAYNRSMFHFHPWPNSISPIAHSVHSLSCMHIPYYSFIRSFFYSNSPFPLSRFTPLLFICLLFKIQYLNKPSKFWFLNLITISEISIFISIYLFIII